MLVFHMIVNIKLAKYNTEDVSKFKQQEPMIRNDPLSSKKNSKSVRLKSQIVSQRKILRYLEQELTEFCNL